MSAHSKIVIAAPDRDILAFDGVTVVHGMWKRLCQTVHLLEDTIGVIVLLLFDLTHEKLIIIKVGMEGIKAGSCTCEKNLQ